MTVFRRVLSICLCTTFACTGAPDESALAESTLETGNNPFGQLDLVTAMPGAFRMKGWAADPDAKTNSLYIWVTIDGVGQHIIADKERLDVQAAYPAYGKDHGFDATLSASAGTHTVCATASNVGAGTHKELGCKTVVTGGSPFGNWESWRSEARGKIRIRGWTIDPDTTGPVYIWVTVDGAGRHIQANTERTDVGAAHAGYGDDHGFDATLNALPGQRTVCVTASDVGAGSHKQFGCHTVDVLGDDPIGNLEVIGQHDGSHARIRGWALDPNTTNPIYLWVTVDGVGHHVSANRSRPDVGARYPSLGANHGFDHIFPIDPANSPLVCVTASDVGAGSHQTLGCKRVPPGTPFPNSAWARPKFGPNGGIFTSCTNGHRNQCGALHNGVDFRSNPRAAYDVSVYAARAGIVLEVIAAYCRPGVNCSNSSTGWATPAPYFMSGDKVIIEHVDGYLSVYNHCGNTENLRAGDRISQGEKVCELNRTGNRQGAHLHFAILTERDGNRDVDPRSLIPGLSCSCP